MFANPGSTEIPLLANLPGDLEFVLGLHEASVVGIATGASIATGEASLVLLHTTAGLGNAVAAIATARENRVPLVILVGQQDRRHLISEPFLAGRLDGLAGEYPVWTGTPPRPEDLPAIIERAIHEATVRLGPAIVVVPMDDWLREVPAREPQRAAPRTVRGGAGVSNDDVDELLGLIAAAASPAFVVGADLADDACWDSLASLAGKLGAPVWNEPFGARPGFDQTSPYFAGLLSPRRDDLRAQLREHDLIVVLGCHALRQYGFVEGPLFEQSRVVTIVADPAQAMASATDLAVIAPLRPFLSRVDARVVARETGHVPARREMVASLPEDRFTAEHLLTELGTRLPRDAVLVEEAPSDRSALSRLIPAANPLGFVSAAMGGLGFGLPVAAGLKMALPDRPVVAILGDGSTLYSVQGLWSAQHYGLGALYVIIANGGYAIMDRLATAAGSDPAWPGFGDIDFAALAGSFGCEARRVASLDELRLVLDDVLPGLARRRAPLVLVAEVARL